MLGGGHREGGGNRGTAVRTAAQIAPGASGKAGSEAAGAPASAPSCLRISLCLSGPLTSSSPLTLRAFQWLQLRLRLPLTPKTARWAGSRPRPRSQRQFPFHCAWCTFSSCHGEGDGDRKGSQAALSLSFLVWRMVGLALPGLLGSRTETPSVVLHHFSGLCSPGPPLP